VRGDKFIGGTFSFNTQQSSGGLNESETKASSFEVSPSIGYFLNEKLSIGGGLGYSVNHQKNIYDFATQEYTSRYITVGAFVKRYFMISDKFFFTVRVNASYGRGVQINETGGSESKSKGYNIALSAQPSLLFFPSPKWGIEGSIGSLGFAHYRDLSYGSKKQLF
jgi:lipopolysaccharide assembly outer membrane protein LptD (OstA)